MMDTRIDVRQALRVFQKIQELGTRDGETFTYKGITATSDFDGYTIVLRDDYVTLTVLFHNRFSLEHRGPLRLNHFLEQLNAIDRERKDKSAR